MPCLVASCKEEGKGNKGKAGKTGKSKVVKGMVGTKVEVVGSGSMVAGRDKATKEGSKVEAICLVVKVAAARTRATRARAKARLAKERANNSLLKVSATLHQEAGHTVAPI